MWPFCSPSGRIALQAGPVGKACGGGCFGGRGGFLFVHQERFLVALPFIMIMTFPLFPCVNVKTQTVAHAIAVIGTPEVESPVAQGASGFGQAWARRFGGEARFVGR